MLQISSPFKTVRFIDDSQEIDSQDPLWNHAVDEAIANSVAKGLRPPTIRCWRYDQAVMLGRRDMRLPEIGAAMEWLCGEGYDVAVRPCGGTAVPLTKDVLNISFIFPTNDYIQYPLNNAFQMMADLLIHALAPIANVTIGEVHGSYCPGDFDLAIDGFKIAGIAQRRIMGTIIIQAYLLVKGDGKRLFALMQDMYERAGYYRVVEARRPLPKLDLETNRSIQEITGMNVQPEQVAQYIASTIQDLFAEATSHEQLSQNEYQYAAEERKRFIEILKLDSKTRKLKQQRSDT